MISSPLSQLIKQKRLALKWSRKDLALKAGISYTTLKNAENGKHAPTASTRVKLAAALDLPELIEAEPPVRALLALTSAQSLADLMSRYNVAVVVQALRLARIDLWALFAALFPVSAAAAQTMAGLDVGALAAEQRRESC